MPFLYKDYTDLIVKAYSDQRNADQLSRLLMHPTTANIKQACLNVYLERIKKGEEEKNTLESFFGVPPAGKSLDYVIGRCSPDKFRPLQSLIKGEIKNPNLINVELLAWLIDFSPRPWVHAQKMFNTNDTIEPFSQIEDSIDSQPQPDPVSIDVTGAKTALLGQDTLQSETYLGDDRVDSISTSGRDGNSNQPTKKLKNHLLNSILKKGAVISVIVAILLGGIYITLIGSGNTGCMYWAGDSYAQVPCNEEISGRLTLPMNPDKMKNFKKITKEDTITEKSIGVIYYLKTDNKLEYFTIGGNHPVYINRTLKILSDHIFDKYLSKNSVPGVDSLAEQNRKSITARN